MFRFFGRGIRSWRAGAEYRVGEDPRFAQVPRELELRSVAFQDQGPLPPGDASPPLAWNDPPDGTCTFALVVEDVDSPTPRPLVHAIAYNLEAAQRALDEGALESTRTQMGCNAVRRRAYIPPAPLPGHGVHRYIFTLIAVDYVPHFDQPPTRMRLLDAVAGHALALAELTGTRER